MTAIQYPPLRIAVLIVVIGIGVSVERLDVLAALLLVGGLFLAAARVPLHSLWCRVQLVLPFILFMFLFFPLAVPGQGWHKALMYSTRLLFSLQMLTLMFYRLTPAVFFQSLLHLRVPPILVEMLLFTMRYIDVFRQEAQQMVKSYRSRGYRDSWWFSPKSYVVLSRVVAALMLRVFRRSEKVYIGMMSRGYQGVPAARDLPNLQSWDVVKAGVMTGIIAFLLIWSKL